MLSENRFREILKKLLEKSRKDLVAWEDSYGPSGYRVAFSPDTVIHIELHKPEAEPDFAVAEFRINDRRILSIQAEDGNDDFELLRDLYVEADRTVVGWDKALHAVERELDSDRPVGTRRTVPDVPEGPADDDVPF